MLGVILFSSTSKGLELTPETEAGLEALRSGFLQFEEAVRAMQAGQTSKSLTIAAPRDFTAKWLNARLARYSASDGELRFSMMAADEPRSEEHTSELQSLMRISYAVFCLKKKNTHIHTVTTNTDDITK